MIKLQGKTQIRWKHSSLPPVSMSAFNDPEDAKEYFRVNHSRFQFEYYKDGGYSSNGHLISRNELLREDCYVPFQNCVFHLGKVLDKSESIEQVKENLIQINRWCFLNVGPAEYGFFTPGLLQWPPPLMLVNNNRGLLYVHACTVFKHEADALAFKLRF